ncbi:MAG TPA: copper resistance protein B [Caulobacteraceae bacterium]|jgi:copper resistance protein B
MKASILLATVCALALALGAASAEAQVAQTQADQTQATPAQTVQPQTAQSQTAQSQAVANPNNTSPYGQAMGDNQVSAHLLVEQLEARLGNGGADLRWETQGWVGTDEWKLWVRDEGERLSEGRVEDGQLEAFIAKPISTYWNVLVGGRYDLDSGPGRGWAAVGIEGLAPRFFNVSATAYAGPQGLAGKIEVYYDQLITNRLILEPQAEFDLYSQNDPARKVGAGLSDIDAGIRLRYEITRKIAPYIGVAWQPVFGRTADYAHAAGEDTGPAVRFAIGITSWF